MIIFLFGKDSFRSLKKLGEIIDKYKEKHEKSLSFHEFDSKTNFKDFRDQFQTKSIFQENKLLVLKDIFSNPKFKKEFLESEIDFTKSKHIIVFHETEEVKKKDPLFVYLKKNSKSQEFELLKGKKLQTWIIKELSEVKIDSIALKLLIQYTEKDPWKLSNEIHKLANYGVKRITEEHINLLVHPSLEQNIFQTIDSISSKQKQKAINLIHQHIEKGDSPLYLLSMIAFQFRNLLIMKDMIYKGKNINELKWHPFVIKKTYRLSQSFELKQLKKIYQKIVETDLNIKTGKVDPEMGLELLIAQI